MVDGWYSGIFKKNRAPKMVDGSNRQGVVGRKLYGKQRLQVGCRADDDDDDHHHHQNPHTNHIISMVLMLGCYAM